MSAPKWDKSEDSVLIQLHNQGKSCNAIAKEMGRSPAAISDHSRQLGLKYDGSMVVAATLARVTNAAALRTELELQLLEDASRLRRQLFAPAKAYNFGGKDNTFAEHQLPMPSARDQLDIMKATTIAVQHSLKISEHDVNAGTGAAIGMLDKIAEGINIAALDLDLDLALADDEVL